MLCILLNPGEIPLSKQYADGAPIRFGQAFNATRFPIDYCNNTGYPVACFAKDLACFLGRAPCRHNIVHDHDAGSSGQLVFDAVSRSVLFGLFADDRSMSHWMSHLCRPHHDGCDDEIGAQRQSPDRAGDLGKAINFLQYCICDQEKGFSLQRGRFAIEVERRRLAGA